MLRMPRDTARGEGGGGDPSLRPRPARALRPARMGSEAMLRASCTVVLSTPLVAATRLGFLLWLPAQPGVIRPNWLIGQELPLDAGAGVCCAGLAKGAVGHDGMVMCRHRQGRCGAARTHVYELSRQCGGKLRSSGAERQKLAWCIQAARHSLAYQPDVCRIPQRQPHHLKHMHAHPCMHSQPVCHLSGATLWLITHHARRADHPHCPGLWLQRCSLHLRALSLCPRGCPVLGTPVAASCPDRPTRQATHWPADANPCSA